MSAMEEKPFVMRNDRDKVYALGGHGAPIATPCNTPKGAKGVIEDVLRDRARLIVRSFEILQLHFEIRRAAPKNNVRNTSEK